MNRDDIIRMAREAMYLNGDNVPSWHELERFADLVAAAEREACAKVCEEKAKAWKAAGYFGSTADYGECAAAIRARGQNDGH
jgi:hypothetical protein